MKTSTERNRAIDALRGFAMLMVVYHHVLQKAWEADTALSAISGYWRMPLFFFISGFLASGLYDWALFKCRCANRLRYQLMPTVVMALAFCAAFGISVMDMLEMSTKMGYWYPYALAVICIAYMALSFGLGLLGCGRRGQATVMATLALGLGALAIYTKGMAFGTAERWIDIFAARKIVAMAPYFLVGVTVGLYRERWNLLLGRRWVVGVCLIAFLLCCKWQWFDLPVNYLKGLLGIASMWGIFSLLAAYFSAANLAVRNPAAARLGAALCALGRSTLPVYLLHYFPIALLAATDLSILLPVDAHPLFRLLPLITAILITALCLLISRLLRRYPSLHRLTLGRP
ncbi:MAG: acyltransferase [Bacteroidales bacterium]|nr:acyltransferase [Bacteroidales bacterium]